MIDKPGVSISLLTGSFELLPTPDVQGAIGKGEQQGQLTDGREAVVCVPAKGPYQERRCHREPNNGKICNGS